MSNLFQPLPIRQYDGGMVSIYRGKADKKSTFGAALNVTGLGDMAFVVKLCFGRLSIRQQDAEFAEQKTFTLSEKIRTQYRPGVDTQCYAVIDGYLYHIEYVDTDAKKTELYLYLQGVRKLDA